MLFTVGADIYDEEDCRENGYGIIVSAKDTIEAVQKVADYYGEPDITYLSIKPFAPDDMLIFELKNTEEADEFYFIQQTLGEKVIW